MSDFFSSLRSLLPEEYVTGSSTSDHLEEAATKYIKDLEKSVKELADKRDKLKSSSSSTNDVVHDHHQHGIIDETAGSSFSSNDSYYVLIHMFDKRLEIEISVKVQGEDVFPLSKLLNQVILEQGLDVVSCVSSTTEFHTWKCVIHCDLVNEETSIDASKLQQRLESKICSYVS